MVLGENKGVEGSVISWGARRVEGGRPVGARALMNECSEDVVLSERGVAMRIIAENSSVQVQDPVTGIPFTTPPTFFLPPGPLSRQSNTSQRVRGRQTRCRESVHGVPINRMRKNPRTEWLRVRLQVSPWKNIDSTTLYYYVHQDCASTFHTSGSQPLAKAPFWPRPC